LDAKFNPLPSPAALAVPEPIVVAHAAVPVSADVVPSLLIAVQALLVPSLNTACSAADTLSGAAIVATPVMLATSIVADATVDAAFPPADFVLLFASSEATAQVRVA
jgi:hypothetical protein